MRSTHFALSWLASLAACAAPYPDLERIAMPSRIPEHLLQFPGLEPREVPMFLNPDLADPAVGYRNSSGEALFVEVRPAEEEELNFVLAHEYVHVALGPDWAALPYVVEEGLCDRFSAGISTRAARDNRRRVLANLEWILLEHRDALPGDWAFWTRRELQNAPDPNRVAAYTLGFVLAHELPVERLRRLSLRALEAGLDVVPAAWWFDEWSGREARPSAGPGDRERALQMLEAWRAAERERQPGQ